MELVDILNDRKELTGITKGRKQLIKGEYRLSIHIWIINDNGEMLIQQRTANRSMFPNMWTNTGGAAQMGESSLETVKRELKEELNITAEINNLEFIASYKRKMDYVDVWILHGDFKIQELSYQETEVQDAKWIKIEEFEKMINDGKAVKSSYDYFLNYINGIY